jgi:serine/threonine protein phosphatase PrpC
MEDRHVLQRGFNGSGSCTLLAVFDGHRGADVAAYASRRVRTARARAAPAAPLGASCPDAGAPPL